MLLSPLQKMRAALLTGSVRAWMTIRRIRGLEMGAWWLSDRLYNLALLIREGSESLTLHRLDDPTPRKSSAIFSAITGERRSSRRRPSRRLISPSCDVWIASSI